MNAPTDLVAVGHITGAFGVRGWVKIHPYSDDASALLHAKHWFVGRQTTEDRGQKTVGQTPVALSSVLCPLASEKHGDGMVAQLEGVVDRDAAQALKGAVVYVSRGDFPALNDNEFYWVDLIGLAVENCQGQVLGVVVGLIDNGAHPILRVAPSYNEHELKLERAQQREYLIPFVERFIPKVDQANKKIIVDWEKDFLA